MKTPWAGFRSTLADDICRFLKYKRAIGRRYYNEERGLRLLDCFLVERGVRKLDEVTGDVLEAFLLSRPRTCPRSFNQLLGAVRLLLDWLVTEGVLRVSPLCTAARRETAGRIPFIFDIRQAGALLEAAARLADNPRAPLRGPTYRVLFGLLYALGLRVSEACRLRCADLDLERAVLFIRETKFGKSRLVPFGPRVTELLRGYLGQRTSRWGSDDPAPLFTFDGRKGIHPQTVSETFHRLTLSMGLTATEGTLPPRLHHLRHSFAVGTLLRWYREGVEPGARLHQLSTFLGHVDPASTAVYLTITADLLREASRRFESFAGPCVPETKP
ncbi:MAG: tyrosine-type recombinase/integrase [Deltaproteobacteria bacterium]|nr:tyrosine-type recombinase/integrase [Deltaproteobacteria bacterium]